MHLCNYCGTTEYFTGDGEAPEAMYAKARGKDAIEKYEAA
jgi:hypothetical protein